LLDSFHALKSAANKGNLMLLGNAMGIPKGSR
jgi:hypothetical protein